MVNTDALRGLIAEKGLSQSDVAKRLGMTPKTFYTKMSRKIFDSDEIEAMISMLQIPLERCTRIFFAPNVTCGVTDSKEDVKIE